MQETIPVENLVLDDLVIFSAGCQIPADAVVVSGNVQVNESLITGESEEIAKKPEMNCCQAVLWFPVNAGADF